MIDVSRLETDEDGEESEGTAELDATAVPGSVVLRYSESADDGRQVLLGLT